MTQEYHHIPVLLQEVLTFAAAGAGAHVVDATLGGGGYTRAFANAVGSAGAVLSIDTDLDAIKAFDHAGCPENVRTVHGNFRDLAKIVSAHEFANISVIVADLGLSSYELDASGRGISFQRDEVLDMRFDQTSHMPTAADIVNEWSEDELVRVFTEFGEEKFSRKIAWNIVRYRSLVRLERTKQLLDIIANSVPRTLQHRADDSARRIFQALRIAVNGELESLKSFLPQALDLLIPGGRLVLVSFHSLEDRAVKHFFVDGARGCVCPPDFPICQCGKNPVLKILTKQPVTATREEIAQNSRSRPAKLRAAEKL
jgi:16S rRNA (cytosine1402-N4)-methyltransferase